MTTDFSRSSMRRNRSGRGCDAGEPRLLDRHEIWNMRISSASERLKSNESGKGPRLVCNVVAN